ncbi:hypothetical protein Gbro_4625 [Gordonia bronchialis DSM 43247]|uniref:Uncharacterized protein n=1 Tax=Gordonia bronchialis (strain ATCC 25592 / DSM 43247 / BCRC 13721 / JCM 3198 / KCTC 3076 / NBRC 16047 / NCTC 10667) TaxID=526226 RepID=D0L7G4_GORB4|nr:hypothetical protein Gbro_4625 [Gordonia bronchialis DSM 43247]
MSESTTYSWSPVGLSTSELGAKTMMFCVTVAVPASITDTVLSSSLAT